MKLVPCITEEDLKVVRPKTNLWNVLDEFINSGYDVMEVKDFTNKDAGSCAASMGASIKRYKFNCKVMKRGERVFLVRNK